MSSRLIATYELYNNHYDVYDCGDFYDVYEGNWCMNEGEPFYTIPTLHEIITLIELHEAQTILTYESQLAGATKEL